jgi:hypothetical protein
MSEWIRKQDAIDVARWAAYNSDGSYDRDREEFIKSEINAIDGVKFDSDLGYKDEEIILRLADKLHNFAKSNNVNAIELVESFLFISNSLAHLENYDYRN